MEHSNLAYGGWNLQGINESNPELFVSASAGLVIIIRCNTRQLGEI